MSALTLLEREGELALLRDALTQAQEGRGQFVVTRGSRGTREDEPAHEPAEDNQRS